MKQLLKFSLFALAGILFTAIACDAQANYRNVLIQFDKVQNNASVPEKSAVFLDKQIRRSLMELNRMEVLPGTFGVAKAPTKRAKKVVKKVETSQISKPVPVKKANVIAQVIIERFTTRPAGNTGTTPHSIDKGGPFGENSFVVEGQKAVLSGTVEFKDAMTRQVVETRDFIGEYLSIPKAGAPATNKAALLKKAIDKAVENFRNDVKYIFQGEYLIKEVLEGHNNDVLNVLISGGAAKDIKADYEYVAYTKKRISKGNTKKEIVGALTILNVQDQQAMAKVTDGKKAIFKIMRKDGNVFVELK